MDKSLHPMYQGGLFAVSFVMNVAILGAGAIARSMCKTVRGMKAAGRPVELYAVASRSQEKADAFAKEEGVLKAYGSYEDMLRDEEVELVYVASPHSHHYQHTKMCLEYGKHVLVEKAFTVNARQAEELITLAREKGLLLAEAIWTRYMPSRTMIDDVIASGVIGKPISLMANLGYPMAQKERLCKPELAGGALLDVGVYPINFAMMVFHSGIIKVDTTAQMSPEGVDWTNSVTLTFRDGEMAVLHSTMLSPTDRLGVIFGEKGYMEVHNINNCEAIRVYDAGHNLIASYEVPEQINGYEYEVLACMKAIQDGAVECDAMSHGETLRVMGLLDDIRAKWGMKYPGE
jgi:predicted dehydrogenase